MMRTKARFPINCSTEEGYHDEPRVAFGQYTQRDAVKGSDHYISFYLAQEVWVLISLDC